MPRKRRTRVLWTNDDMKQLRKLAGREEVASIAKRLKRSEAAIRFKASTNGIKLAMR